MTVSIPAAGRRELAAAAALSRLGPALTKDVTAQTRAEVIPQLVAAATGRARGADARAVARTGRYSAYRGTPGAAFGGTRAVVSNGTPGRVLARPTEYGADGSRRATFTARSPLGRQYRVTRHTTRQFRPRSTGGKWLAPAADAVAEDTVSTWTELVEAATVAALDGQG